MRAKEFVVFQNLPASWEELLHFELLTGCSNCERRLINNGIVIDGTVVLRVLDDEGQLIVPCVLCAACAPKK